MTYNLWNNDTIRELERNSIREFVESCSEHFRGRRVIDVGCGRQPYREIVEAAGGKYVPYDRASFPANVSGEDVGGEWVRAGAQAVLCTQVVQYWPDPSSGFRGMYFAMERGGPLVMTGPTTWPLVEPEDLHRLTPAGARALCEQAGFTVERCEPRGELALDGGLVLWLGWGIVARA